jgi:hypothetical protein
VNDRDTPGNAACARDGGGGGLLTGTVFRKPCSLHHNLAPMSILIFREVITYAKNVILMIALVEFFDSVGVSTNYILYLVQVVRLSIVSCLSSECASDFWLRMRCVTLRCCFSDDITK